jgi:hypothetical protein
VKPAQDYRFDVPVFGRRTVEVMKEASISTAVLQADNTLILEKPAVLRMAGEAGIQVYGFTA